MSLEYCYTDKKCIGERRTRLRYKGHPCHVKCQVILDNILKNEEEELSLKKSEEKLKKDCQKCHKCVNKKNFPSMTSPEAYNSLSKSEKTTSKNNGSTKGIKSWKGKDGKNYIVLVKVIHKKNIIVCNWRKINDSKKNSRASLKSSDAFKALGLHQQTASIVNGSTYEIKTWKGQDGDTYAVSTEVTEEKVICRWKKVNIYISMDIDTDVTNKKKSNVPMEIDTESRVIPKLKRSNRVTFEKPICSIKK